MKYLFLIIILSCAFNKKREFSSEDNISTQNFIQTVGTWRENSCKKELSHGQAKNLIGLCHLVGVNLNTFASELQKSLSGLRGKTSNEIINHQKAKYLATWKGLNLEELENFVQEKIGTWTSTRSRRPQQLQLKDIHAIIIFSLEKNISLETFVKTYNKHLKEILPTSTGVGKVFKRASDEFLLKDFRADNQQLVDEVQNIVAPWELPNIKNVKFNLDKKMAEKLIILANTYNWPVKELAQRLNELIHQGSKTDGNIPKHLNLIELELEAKAAQIDIPSAIKEIRNLLPTWNMGLIPQKLNDDQIYKLIRISIAFSLRPYEAVNKLIAQAKNTTTSSTSLDRNLEILRLNLIFNYSQCSAPIQPQLGNKYVRKIPDLAGTLKEAFTDGNYQKITYKLGAIVFQVQRSQATQAGNWFTSVKPDDAQQAESLLNIFKWGNDAGQIKAYRIIEHVTGYAGQVAGGDGVQFYIPKDVPLDQVLQELKF